VPRRPPSLLLIILGIIAAGILLLVVNNDAGSTFGVENDDFARLIFASVLITVFSAGVVAARHSFGEVARNMAIWLLVIVVLMAGYLYRYELQDVASRLTAGLVPGSPLSITDSTGAVTVTVQKARNGHFEARALIDGEPIRLMIDTGASITVLTAGDAEAVGIDVEALRFTVPVSTANGMALAARAQTDVIAIGEIERRRVPVLVAQQGSLEQSLLGMNFMGSLSGYDVRGDRMVLRN